MNSQPAPAEFGIGMTDKQIAWLNENQLARQRWAYSENAKPYIDELVDAGFMQPAYGEFVTRPSGGEVIGLLGRHVPVETLVSLYCLTKNGRDAFVTGAA